MFHRAPSRLQVGDAQPSLEISDHPETPRSPNMGWLLVLSCMCSIRWVVLSMLSRILLNIESTCTAKRRLRPTAWWQIKGSVNLIQNCQQIFLTGLQRAKCWFGLTYGKTKAEGNISYSIYTSIHCSVANVHQVTKFRHHGTVHHADRKPQPSIRDDQMIHIVCHRDLTTQHAKGMLLYGAT